MRVWATLILAGIAAFSFAQRILLIPLDSRPAAGQFAQMIARMASAEVVMPPYETLGRFTKPGDPEAILDWMAARPMDDVSAVVVSTDMIAYGGLIASREASTPEATAIKRLERLAAIRARYPKVRWYAFSAIMRLYPTSTRQTAPWRVALGRYAEYRDRYAKSPSPALLKQVQHFRAQVPEAELAKYLQARTRDFNVQRYLIKMNRRGVFDYLILGQDDAQPYGPHIQERTSLKALTANLEIEGKTYFCEGVDQLSNILISRALLRGAGWMPRVRIVYSDESAKRTIANYESKNIELSLRDQLIASGARPWTGVGEYDYTVYLNTPNPNPERFKAFAAALLSEIDQGFPCAVADINLGKTGTADPRLFDMLWDQGRMIKLLSYAGWNTAGNTMGTAIPAANVYLLARRLDVDPLKRELTQREFVLHRFVNDFAYHVFTRPEAYRLIDGMPRASRDETYGAEFQTLNDFVRRDMEKHLQKYFVQQFFNKTFFAGSNQFRIAGVEDVKVWLPWPRAYEVRLEFRLQASPVIASPETFSQSSGTPERLSP